MDRIYQLFSPKSKFTYGSSLDSETIRLLRFNELDGPKLDLQISDYRLDEATSYHALSYTWGPPEGSRRYTRLDLKSVLLNGKKHFIYPNLHDALSQLRDLQLAEYYWIDAICIDQSNVSEREIQVSLMDQIYIKASQVDIWIGQADENTDVVLALMRQVAEHADTHVHLQLEDPAEVQRLHLPPLSSEPWDQFIRFFKRNWWRRSWVVQEVALARHAVLLWGDREIEWSDILSWLVGIYSTRILAFLQRIREVKPVQQLAATTAMTIASARGLCHEDVRGSWNRRWAPLLESLAGDSVWGATSGAILAHFLARAGSFEASDPRDKVFSILGMTNRGARLRNTPLLSIPVSYSHNSTPQSVFTNAARTVMTDCNHLGLLVIVGDHTADKIPGLPSWVPDLTTRTSNPPFVHIPGRSDSVPRTRIFDPSGGVSGSALGLHFVGLCLSVQGFYVDTVLATGPPLGDVINATAVEPLACFILQCQELYAPTGQDRIEAVWRTLICDDDHNGSPASPNTGVSFGYFIATLVMAYLGNSARSLEDVMEKIQRLYYYNRLVSSDRTGSLQPLTYFEEYMRRLAENPQFLEPSRQADIGAAAFHGPFSMMAPYRRLFLTRGGYLGLGVQSARVGDTVWVLSDCPIPVTLRRDPNSSDAYNFTGDAYVHGIMYGEAAQGNEHWQEVCIS